MSNLIVPETVRPNRKARLAQKALAARPVPNMQPRQRGIPPVAGCAVGMGPIGPLLVMQTRRRSGNPAAAHARPGPADWRCADHGRRSLRTAEAPAGRTGIRRSARPGQSGRPRPCWPNRLPLRATCRRQTVSISMGDRSTNRRSRGNNAQPVSIQTASRYVCGIPHAGQPGGRADRGAGD